MIDREQFLKAGVPEQVVVIPGAGEVRVRGLTRLEVLGLQALTADQGALERRIIHLGMVDPELDEDDVAAWYAAAPAGHTDLIVEAVSALSGIAAGAPKSGVSGVRRGSRA